MLEASWLWALFTVIAAASQTVRNATQRELTTTLGTAGATHVRFLFGLPFAVLFLVAVVIASGQALPRPPISFWPWVLAGALAQIAATALMLAAMNDRSFVVVYAYIKTEPVQAALFGLAAGSMFALSAVGYRGAILSLGLPNYTMAATYTMVVGLIVQVAVLSFYLWLRDPGA